MDSTSTSVFSRQHHRDQLAGHQVCSLWRIRGKLIIARQARWYGYRADRYSDSRFVVLSCHQEGDQERWRSKRKENRRQPTRHGFGSAARVAVQKLGLSEKDVSIISMGTDTERLSAMTQGVADATVVTIGGYVAAQKLGFHSLLDLSQANVPYEAASMITTRTLIKDNPEMVGKFVKGFVAAIQYAQVHRDVTLKVLSKYMRTADQEILNASYDYYVGRVIPRTPYVSEKGLQAVIDFVRQRNPQTPNVKAQDFMDNRFIKELDESGFIKSLYAK